MPCKPTNTERVPSVLAAVEAWLALPDSRGRSVGSHALYWELLKAFSNTSLLSRPFPVSCDNFSNVLLSQRRTLKERYGTKFRWDSNDNTWLWFPSQG